MMGHFAPEVEAAFVRARELCRRVGDAPELVPTLFGLWRTYVVRMADSEKPKEVAAELLRLAEEDGSAVSRVVAHYAVGFTAHVMGRFSVARGHLQDGIDLYSFDDRDTAAVYRFGQDPGVACCCYLALTEWTLGYPDKALKHMQDGVALARRLDDPFSVAFSQDIASFLDQARGDRESSLEKANEAVSLATEKGFPYWAGIGKVMQGWGKATGNPTRAMIQGFRDRIEHHRAVGTDLFAPYFLNLLGDVALKANQADECIAALDEAETLLNRTGERSWESETHRLHGALLVAQGGDSAEAEGRFEKALAAARQSNAKSDYGSSGRSGMRRASYSSPSTTGSPKASGRLTSRKPKPSSTNSPDSASEHIRLQLLPQSKVRSGRHPDLMAVANRRPLSSPRPTVESAPRFPPHQISNRDTTAGAARAFSTYVESVPARTPSRPPNGIVGCGWPGGGVGRLRKF
jgi:predicted ATPase